MGTYKIYKIITDAYDGTDKFLCYIGSTQRTLSQRLADHHNHYREYLAGKYHYCTSFRVVRQSYHEISLIADLGDVPKKEAERVEGQIMQQYKSNGDYIVVNQLIAGRTRKESQKLYRELNKDTIRTRKQQYALKNKELICAKKKQYRSLKIACPCGGSYTRDHTNRHMQTSKHVEYLAATKLH